MEIKGFSLIPFLLYRRRLILAVASERAGFQEQKAPRRGAAMGSSDDPHDRLYAFR
jgi:hypothetical protein